MTVTRGIEAILDTTFLSVLATPFAAILGMVIAWLVVRKRFGGKEVLDFASNLGGAVPGTILGIGFILAFNKASTSLAIIVYTILGLFFAQVIGKNIWERLIILGVGTAAGYLMRGIPSVQLYYLLGCIFLLVAVLLGIGKRKAGPAVVAALLGVYIMSFNWADGLAAPLADYSRGLERGFWSNAIFQFSDHIKVLLQPNPSLLAVIIFFAGVFLLDGVKQKGWRLVLGSLWVVVPCALSFMEMPFALVGGAYIIMLAFVVRSLPASVRAGVASLQQIDPSIEEASNILGADSQYTFRKVTLPLILPALLAGLIFSFTRHMTSLSAIIFLVSARWRIVTASILSEWEQGGISIAAAYSTVIIIFVMLAIGVLYFVTGRVLKGRGDVDISMGA
jgi:iron(III) transport system permease protein